MRAFLRNPGSFPSETSEVVELRSAHPPSANHLNTFHRGGVERKYALHSDSRRDLPDHKRFRDSTAPTADADPFKGLDPLFFPLTDTVEYPDRIPRGELGDIIAKLLLLELSQ